MLDALTGKLLSTVRLNVSLLAGQASIVADERSHRIFVANSQRVAVLDAATGTVVRIVPATGDDLALDERIGHVFAAGPFGKGVAMLDAGGS